MLRQRMVTVAALLVALPAAPGAARAQSGLAPVVVRLEARVEVPDAIVLVGDVARVGGSDSALVRRVAALDVAEVAGREVGVSREQVALRLRLAGLEPGQFRVEGAGRAVVTAAPVALTPAALVEAARRALRRAAPAALEEATVRPANLVQVPPVALYPGDVVSLDGSVSGAVAVPGRVTAEVGVRVNGARRATARIDLDVRPYQEIAVPRRRIEAKEPLTAENLQLERRPADSANGCLPGRQVLGVARARRVLMPGQPLRHGDVEETPKAGGGTVKPRDLVKLVARVGPLRVTAVGEVLQEGQVGQIIRVRNVDSKGMVQGRLVDPATVEVDY